MPSSCGACANATNATAAIDVCATAASACANATAANTTSANSTSLTPDDMQSCVNPATGALNTGKLVETVIFPELDAHISATLDSWKSIFTSRSIYYIAWFITMSRRPPKVSDIVAVGKAIGWKVNNKPSENWEFRYTREETCGPSSVLIFDLIMPRVEDDDKRGLTQEPTDCIVRRWSGMLLF
jgi:hypothetical protein